jgi:hypothetical protein
LSCALETYARHASPDGAKASPRLIPLSSGTVATSLWAAASITETASSLTTHTVFSSGARTTGPTGLMPTGTRSITRLVAVSMTITASRAELAT